MASPTLVRSMPANRPTPIESRALGTLSYIRASIDSAGSLAVPGTAGLVMGLIGTLAAVLASLPALRSHWLEIWVGSAGLAFLLGGALMARKVAGSGRSLLFTPLKKFLLCLCPALFAGVALTLILSRAGLYPLVPGCWLLLYGCAVIPASTVTNARHFRVIACMGIAFVALGLTAFASPTSWHTPLLGAGFGGLHLLTGFIIGRTDHGE